MKPDNLGNTPVFSGIANGLSRGMLMQNGRLLYSEMVPAGPCLEVKQSRGVRDGGKGDEVFSLVWTAPGVVEVTLTVTGDNNVRAGTFVFRMQAAGALLSCQACLLHLRGIKSTVTHHGEQNVTAPSC